MTFKGIFILVGAILLLNFYSYFKFKISFSAAFLISVARENAFIFLRIIGEQFQGLKYSGFYRKQITPDKLCFKLIMPHRRELKSQYFG